MPQALVVSCVLQFRECQQCHKHLFCHVLYTVGVPTVPQAPVLMLRPRAWNMVEHHVLVNGEKVPGPVVDFAILMYHASAQLYASGSGPFFYLSKASI